MGRETNKQRRQRQAATAREKAAAAKAVQHQAEQRRRAMVVIATVVVLAVLGGIGAVIALNSKSKQANDRVTAQTPVVASLTSIQPAALQSVGPGAATLLAKPTSGDPPLTSGGKPELLYVGGEFCPYCAAERWSLVQALSRFGTFSHLSQIRSASTDLNLATFSFYKSSYRSKYLSFVPVEAEDRNQKQLQQMTSDQAKIFGKYTNGFPFLDYGGKYYQTNAGYNPSDLSGLTWQQIATDVKTPTSKVAQDILGEANNVTATVCKMTNNQPTKVCLNPAITTLQSRLGA